MDKKIIISIVLFTFVILGGGIFFISSSSPAALTASANANFTVDTKTYDFGTVALNGAKVTKTYTIKNSGTEDLKITNVKTSCGCTTATVTIDGVKSPAFGMHTESNWVGTASPGKTAEITAVFDQAFHGPQGAGEITRVVSFATNDPQNPKVELMMSGTVVADNELKKEVIITPATQDLGTVIYGDIAKTTFTLANNTVTPLQVTKVTTSCSCTTARLDKEELVSGEKTTLNVSFNPAIHKDDTDLGQLTRTIYIETDNKNFPKLQASFDANVIKQ